MHQRFFLHSCGRKVEITILCIVVKETLFFTRTCCMRQVYWFYNLEISFQNIDTFHNFGSDLSNIFENLALDCYCFCGKIKAMICAEFFRSKWISIFDLYCIWLCYSLVPSIWMHSFLLGGNHSKLHFIEDFANEGFST